MAGETPKKIQLSRIAHVYYKYKPEELDAARQFHEDFGFFETKREGNRTYYRGYGVEPFVICAEAADKTEFGGAAFAVDTLEELERAAKVLPAESRPTGVYDLKDAPGGGKCVTLYDPVDGFPMHIVWGQERVEPLPLDFPEVKPNFVSTSRPDLLLSRAICTTVKLTTNQPTPSLSPRSRIATSTRRSGSGSGRRPCTS